jgi:hypothetical protein
MTEVTGQSVEQPGSIGELAETYPAITLMLAFGTHVAAAEAINSWFEAHGLSFRTSETSVRRWRDRHNLSQGAPAR